MRGAEKDTHPLEYQKEVTEMVDINTGLIAIGAAAAIVGSAIAAAIAEKEIGTAAVGAMAEKEQLFGKALILTVIPETIVIFGMVVAILIIGLATAA